MLELFIVGNLNHNHNNNIEELRKALTLYNQDGY